MSGPGRALTGVAAIGRTGLWFSGVPYPSLFRLLTATTRMARTASARQWPTWNQLLSLVPEDTRAERPSFATGSVRSTTPRVFWPCLGILGGHTLGSMEETTPKATTLENADCWKLLRSVSVARLAVWVDDHPDIFPINYKVDHGTVVFRTGSGTKLNSSLGKEPVALEADGVDVDAGVAWSVVVKGRATELDRTEELLDTVGLLLFPWETGRKDHFIRVTPTSITGRRFSIAPPLTWWSPLDTATRAGLE